MRVFEGRAKTDCDVCVRECRNGAKEGVAEFAGAEKEDACGILGGCCRVHGVACSAVVVVNCDLWELSCLLYTAYF